MDSETYRSILAQVKQVIVSRAAVQVELRKARRQRKLEYRQELEHAPEEAAAYRTFFSETDSERACRSRAIRYHLLAYAYLRGRAYAQVEPNCRMTNKPQAYALHHFLVRLAILPLTTEARTYLEQWLAGSVESPYTRPPRQPQISAPVE